MIINVIKKSIGVFRREQATEVNWPSITEDKVECSIDETPIDCEELQENYTGVDVSDKSLKVLNDTFPRAKTIHYDRYNNMYNHNGKEYCSWCLSDKYDVIFSYSVFTHTSFTEFKDVFNKHKEHLNKDGIMIHTFADIKNKEHTEYLLTEKQFKIYSPNFEELYRYDDELSIEYKDKKCDVFNSFFDFNYVEEKLNCYVDQNSPLLTTAIYERA